MKRVEIGGSIYGAVNRQWYQAASRRSGQEVADEIHHEVWFAEGGAGDHENFTTSKLMGFENDDGARRATARGPKAEIAPGDSGGRASIIDAADW